MNPILLIAYNNLELTKKAVESAINQDIPITLYLVDNGSTDGTGEWVDDLAEIYGNVKVTHYEENRSPLKITNELLPFLLPAKGFVLGMPNDIRLPSNCYSELLKWPRGFVCASDNGQNDPEVREARAVSENTPMAVMLIRDWAYQAIMDHSGYFFDEGFWMYASDCDLAIRMASCGIRGVQIDTPFWHYSSATLKLADSAEKIVMEIQADADRAYFERKWGFRVDSLEYGRVAEDLNFGKAI
jgi:glycosyltransferase involved in cell wall biosynthesis